MDEFTRGRNVPLYIFIITFLFTSFIAHAQDFEIENNLTAVLAQPISVSAIKKSYEYTYIRELPAEPIAATRASEAPEVTSQLATTTAAEATKTATSSKDITKKPTESAVKTAPKKPAQKAKAPVRLTIPEIDLNTRVVAVGKDSVGNMDVPSGDTTNVGWYKYGPVPGEIGTAVLDAHVFAAFEDLDQVRVGDVIYTEMDNGEKLKFRVEKTRVYKLSELKSDTLFGSRGIRGLNLITCAGELTADRSTYTHRLIVFTKLIT